MTVYTPYDEKMARSTGISASLQRFIPNKFYVSAIDSSSDLNANDSIASTPYFNTPSDLTSITVAQDVLAVDYVVNNNAKAVALAITTLKKAYNHTKSICDRFRGATLLSTDTIRINGYRFILFNMLQPDGTKEYSITFDVGKHKTGDSLFLQSKWLITQYSGYDSVFNFQVWSLSPSNTVKLTTQVLNSLSGATGGSIYQVDSNFCLPQTWIANGVRSKGLLNITVTNNTAALSQLGYELMDTNMFNKSEALDVATGKKVKLDYTENIYKNYFKSCTCFAICSAIAILSTVKEKEVVRHKIIVKKKKVISHRILHTHLMPI
jgi:hypothetical protein